jgi:hypothetical protein
VIAPGSRGERDRGGRYQHHRRKSTTHRQNAERCCHGTRNMSARERIGLHAPALEHRGVQQAQ